MPQDIKYPKIKVRLSGKDGNAFFILGTVDAALKEHGITLEERNAFNKEATSGDYNDLLCTCMRWVTVA